MQPARHVDLSDDTPRLIIERWGYIHGSLNRYIKRRGSRVWLLSEKVWATVIGQGSVKIGVDDKEYGDGREIEHYIRVRYEPHEGGSVCKNVTKDEYAHVQYTGRTVAI